MRSMRADSSITKRGRNYTGVSLFSSSSVAWKLIICLVEEKYHKPEKAVKGQYGDKYDEDSESSNDEDEDDDGFLATEELDAEISATLQAIRSKDPRVYNEKITFYTPIEEVEAGSAIEKKEKPMYLRDYHRENLLKGNVAVEDTEEEAPRTFAQEQDDLQKDIVRQMHAAAEESSSDGDDDEDEGFLVPKSKPEISNEGVHPSRVAKVKVDVAIADKDPDTFLSNFMSARAWVPSDGARFQPLESDDDEEDKRAEKFEAAYNLRFEDPKGSNEMLKSYARDVVAAKSVRREEPNSRKKQRDAQREKREAEKTEREEERAQLRRLKIEEMEEKLQKIKKAAGIKGKTLRQEEWTKFLDEGYDDDKWDEEFTKHFGDDYYAEQEAGSDSDASAGNETGKKNKLKKPKWDDDIDIKDLIPEFEEEEESHSKPAFTISDSEEEESEGGETPRKSRSSKDRAQEKQAKKKAARIERKKIEELVDSRLDLDMPLKSNHPVRFRYRETSPTSFGLTARDILMAPDSSLNQFAGLKKMAAFRDADKKRKDKKHLGKKARLRQWRKETFGNEDGPEIIIGGNAGAEQEVENGVDIVEGRKKKKRSRKSKAKAEV